MAYPGKHRAMISLCLLVAAACGAGQVAAQPAGTPVRITVITDLDGDMSTATCTTSARERAGSTRRGWPWPTSAVRCWADRSWSTAATRTTSPARSKLAEDAFDAGADLLMDVQNSPIALAVSKVAAERHRLAIVTLAATPALTRAACNRNTYHYSFDAPAIARATATSVARAPDGKRWVAIVADANFGRGALAAFKPFIEQAGGTILKSFVEPVGADLGGVLKEAEALHPDVIGVFSAGPDADEKVAAVVASGTKARVTTALLYLSDVDRVGDGYAGVRATVPWAWNLDAASRAWADRFAAAHDGARPTAAQAADYSATTQWLQAVKAAGTTDADAVTKVLDGHKFEDMFARHAEWRASDHAVIHDLYVVDVLPTAALAETHGWFRVIETIPAEAAFPAEAGSGCKM